MEPERPIEKLLREAAAKRRTQADLPDSLHPADRRMLQAEVRKAYPTKAGSSGKRWNLWPQLGWSFAVITGILLAASMMLPHRDTPQGTFAYNQSKEYAAAQKEEKPVREPLSSTAPSATPSQLAGNDATIATANLNDISSASDSRKLESRADKQMTAERSLSANAPVSEQEAFRRRYGLGPSSPSASAPSPTTPAPTQPTLATRSSAAPAAASGGAAGVANSPRDELAAKSALESAGLSRRQRFVSVPAQESKTKAAKAAAPAPTPRVLTDFELQEDAGRLRVIDQDGSVYTGAFEAPSADLLKDSAKKPDLLGGRVEADQFYFDGKQAGETLSFQVRGTNRTLRQAIVFKGQISSSQLDLKPQANLGAQQSPAGNSVGRARTEIVAPSGAIKPLTNAVIKGEWTGGTSTIPVNARASDHLK
jgi:hypothetical protein